MRRFYYKIWQLLQNVTFTANCDSAIVNDQPTTNYDVGNEIIYNIEALKSNLCDYNDAYTLVRGDITIKGRKQATYVAF